MKVVDQPPCMATFTVSHRPEPPGGPLSFKSMPSRLQRRPAILRKCCPLERCLIKGDKVDMPREKGRAMFHVKLNAPAFCAFMQWISCRSA
jgi:hypothetical protein